MQKQCTKCNIIKSFDEFSKDKNKKDGLYSSCKLCKKQTDKKSNEKHHERKKEYDKIYYAKNTDEIKKRSSKWYLENKEYCLEMKKEWYTKNFEKVKILREQYKQQNITKWKDYMKIYQRERYRKNLHYKIKTILNKRIRDYIKKTDKTLDIIGCSIEFFIKWIEYQFDTYMSWENQGLYWEFDHVIPCSSFNFDNNDDIYICYHWSNLRPLEKKENSSKGNKIIPDIISKHQSLANTFNSLFI